MRSPILILLAAAIAGACGGDGGTGPQIETPVITAVSPAYGTVGTEVRIDGSAFDATDVTVFFGTFESPAVTLENGALFAAAPEGLVLGEQYDVRVVNRGSKSATRTAAFEAVEPRVVRVNGVTKPTGLVGMLVLIENDAFGDAEHGSVFFRATDGDTLRAAIADSANDWSNTYIVTTVPTGTADSSWILVETATGIDSIQFSLIQNGTFSPASINWTKTAALPQALQGLGAVFVPVENDVTTNYIFAAGGADATGAAVADVYRAGVAQSGALNGWTTGLAALPAPRAYHAMVAATAYTAALEPTVGGFLYVLGGVDATGAPTQTAYVAQVGLDGTVGSWTSTAALPVALQGASAVAFRGFIYLAGGADAGGVAQDEVYRAPVQVDGTLGAWEPIGTLPAARSYFTLANFGPYLYAVGGETGTTTASGTALTGTETANVELARINLRTGGIGGTGWLAVAAMSKSRSKHGVIFAGGSLLTTSGIYSGIGVSGSSENTYAAINSDGTLASWAGATGAETINTELGYSLYNPAVVTFIDDAGNGHVLVLGGANTSQEGVASAEVVYY